MITLAPRAIIELEHTIRTVYEEYVKDCELCSRISITVKSHFLFV